LFYSDHFKHYMNIFSESANLEVLILKCLTYMQGFPTITRTEITKYDYLMVHLKQIMALYFFT